MIEVYDDVHNDYDNYYDKKYITQICDFSSFKKKWANRVEVKGEVDIRIAAKLLWTSLTP